MRGPVRVPCDHLAQGRASESGSLIDLYQRLLFDFPAPRLAAMLLHHADVGHDHAAVDGLAHVVDGQQADLHRRQRFNKINNLVATA